MPGFKNKKPKLGFDRPTASAGQKVDREWRDVYPGDLYEGDIVAGMGLVVGVLPFPDCRGDIHIEAGYPECTEYFLPQDIKVKAFVRKAD